MARKFKKSLKSPKAIRVLVTFQEEELVKIKTEEELENLFNTKVETAMHNFKVDMRKFYGFTKEGNNQTIESSKETV